MPKVPTKTKIINMSLPFPLYERVEDLAEREQVSRSEILKRALRNYLASEERWQMIRKWGEETAKKFNIKTEEDVDRIIHEFRESE